jgi:hypothetical protein
MQNEANSVREEQLGLLQLRVGLIKVKQEAAMMSDCIQLIQSVLFLLWSSCWPCLVSLWSSLH